MVFSRESSLGCRSCTYFQKVKDFHRQFVVKIGVLWFGHIINEYDAIPLRLEALKRNVQLKNQALESHRNKDKIKTKMNTESAFDISVNYQHPR